MGLTPKERKAYFDKITQLLTSQKDQVMLRDFVNMCKRKWGISDRFFREWYEVYEDAIDNVGGYIKWK